MMRLRACVLLSCALSMTGCMAPPTPSQRVSDAVRETNLAARFGRMDVAMEHTADGMRRHFAQHRKEWGNAVRVLDFEVSSLQMKDSEHATVSVDIQWTRVDENTLRMTRVEQEWRGSTGDHGWTMVRERRIGGDLGLFGEPVPEQDRPKHHGDVQFASKTIR